MSKEQLAAVQVIAVTVILSVVLAMALIQEAIQ